MWKRKTSPRVFTGPIFRAPRPPISGPGHIDYFDVFAYDSMGNHIYTNKIEHPVSVTNGDTIEFTWRITVGEEIEIPDPPAEPVKLFVCPSCSLEKEAPEEDYICHECRAQ